MGSRRAVFSQQMLEDLNFWVRADRRVALRILRIVDDTLQDPSQGLGKPERLRGALAGFWSRRVTQEHRLVYQVTDDEIRFLQARYHY